MRTRHTVYILLFVILAAGGGFVFFHSQPSVTVAHPARGPAVEAVYATGEVEPVRWAKVGPKSTARIVEIRAREGDRVTRHQLLARLSDDEAAARVDQLAAQDGEPGETVTSTQVLFWVGETSPLRITAEVDEEDIPRIRPGSRTLIKADAFPGQVLEGRVAEITPKGDPVNKSYRIRVALPDDTPLKTGMTTEINIIVRETSNALLIPSGAVTNNMVWVVRAGKAASVGRNNRRALRRMSITPILPPCLIIVAPGIRAAPISSPSTCCSGMATTC